MNFRAALLGLLLAVAPAGVRAVQPDEIMRDPVLEARARAISAGLRCLVCQNQSIDDSEAGLARDLRLIVRERLSAGDTDDAVRRFLVARYGDFVLLKPPFRVGTALLWATPVLVLLAGAGSLALQRRRRTPTAPLTAEERTRIEALTRGG